MFIEDHKVQTINNNPADSSSTIIIHRDIYGHFGHEKSIEKIAKNQTIIKNQRTS